MLHEVYVFLSAIGAGIITGFIYDLFRMKRKALKTRPFLVCIEDIVFWVFTAMLVFIAAYLSNQGEIRLYFFISMLLGIIVYNCLFSRWVTQILTFIVKLIIWPFAKLIKLLKPPIRWLMKLIGMGKEKTSKRLKNYSVKAGRRLKSLKNIMRKV
jgi:spore cortex biosynthesis protein YabQ